MDRVVTVNLGGNAYALEEAAYTALSAYLAAAERALAANPDKTEIIKDLEAAIADRIAGHLHAHKTVVTAAEMAETLAAMGPVEGAEAGDREAPWSDRPRPEDARRRLFRLREGAVLAGVCTGLAAYTRVDLALIRIGVVIAAIFATPFAIVAYIVAMFAIPSANTAEEWSAAHGLPATAQQVIDEARRRFDEVSEKPLWARWTSGGADARRPAEPPQRFTAPARAPAGLVGRIAAGIAALFMAGIGAAATLGLVFVMASLVLYNEVLGFAPAFDAPQWIALLIVALLFAAFALPLQTLRQSAFGTMADVGEPQARAIDALVSLGLVAFSAWALWLYWPPAHDLVEDLLWVLRD
jgi:phage shock protein PspC (stress-responsive transcriptional regulator)